MQARQSDRMMPKTFNRKEKSIHLKSQGKDTTKQPIDISWRNWPEQLKDGEIISDDMIWPRETSHTLCHFALALKIILTSS